MKIAIVHDWLVAYTAAERVLAALFRIWPEADLFAVIDFFSDEDRAQLGGKRATTTFIQRLPWAKSHYPHYLSLMPLAIEQLDLSAYDLIISSSHTVAKGVLSGPDQLHISYVHSPLSHAWDPQHQYVQEAGLNKGLNNPLARWSMHYMRLWDQRTAAGVDAFISNSAFIGRRIAKAYRRDSTVIYPPVDTLSCKLQENKQAFYLTASRMLAYTKMPMIIQAFSAMPDKRLIVIGDGPQMSQAQAACGPNVTLLGYQPLAVLREHMQNAQAFVLAAKEDFGITAVEAQACGTPVIAFGEGSALETIRGLDEARPTGVFYLQQSVQALVGAVHRFESEQYRITAQACRKNAERFSEQRFELEIRNFIAARLRESGLFEHARGDVPKTGTRHARSTVVQIKPL